MGIKEEARRRKRKREGKEIKGEREGGRKKGRRMKIEKMVVHNFDNSLIVEYINEL